jgi:signal transduction histidine kinase
MPHLNFTIDSALLKELGERLVGRPHIALAELVKNGYDADARTVTIRLLPDQDRIEIQDDGHGMDFEEFRDFWMRIGTTHKDQKRASRDFKRPMTGSKGVGRLSVQFLASELRLHTVVKKSGGTWLEAHLNWSEAVKAGDLTSAKVQYKRNPSNPPFEQGTLLILRGLKQRWTANNAIQSLAQELWWLQPPFRLIRERGEIDTSFHIEFESSEREFEKTFNKQMRAILNIWTARIVGKNENGHVNLAVQFDDGGPPQSYEYEVKNLPHNSGKYDPDYNLRNGGFEIRIFKLTHRQPQGIKVDDARKYFETHGGVHVYDGGFRLPYYGNPKNDWLGLEIAHSHRVFLSELLPKNFQANYAHTQRLRYLPTLERIFGVVNVNTSREPGLDIMITRDRLADGKAFADLSQMVRYALDLYAMEAARRAYEEDQKNSKALPQKFEQVEEVLEYYQPQIPEPVYKEIRKTVEEATKAAASSESRVQEEMGLLGALATAGISAVAYQHELGKQFGTIQEIINRIEGIRTDDQQLEQSLESMARDLSRWVERARATNALFDYLADAENTKIRQRFQALSVFKDIERQTRFFARGIEVDISGIDSELRLPEATLAEWGAIFQNVFTNAFTAMLDSEERLLQVNSRVQGRNREILVQDTGYGVDLRTADRLFQPFERASKISSARRALGYGGTGLGLTIVRLLADRIGCRVGFIEPEEGFSTTFSLSWRETQ